MVVQTWLRKKKKEKRKKKKAKRKKKKKKEKSRTEFAPYRAGQYVRRCKYVPYRPCLKHHWGLSTRH